jgi:hypothetical protein
MREEAERVDREWMDSITKGPNGVLEQLQRLGESTSGETIKWTIPTEAALTRDLQCILT